MQHTQQNYRVLVFLALLGLGIANPAVAGTVAQPTPPDPLLDGAPGPCDPRLAGADFMPGVDVNGRAVAPADPDAGEVAMPKQILMPLNSHSPNPPLAVIKNPVPAPPPACPPAQR